MILDQQINVLKRAKKSLISVFEEIMLEKIVS